MSDADVSSTYDWYIEYTSTASTISDSTTSPTDSATSLATSTATSSSVSSSPSSQSSTFASITSQVTPQAAAITSTSSLSTSALSAAATTQHHGLSSGAVAAAVIVPLLVVGTLIGALFFWLRRRRARGGTSSSAGNQELPYDYNEKTPATLARGYAEPTPADYNNLVGFPVAAKRPSMSTARSTRSSISPHPPILPPIETYSFQRSVSTEILDPEAVASARNLPAAAAATTLRRGDSGSSSNSSSNDDPFATPSPSTVYTRGLSMVSNPHIDNFDQNPSFTLRRASSPPIPMTDAAATPMPFHLQRPPPAAVRTESNNTINTVSSQHASITPSFADEDNDDEAQVVNVAEAMPVTRVPRQRASVVDSGRRHGREGSAGSASVDSIGEAF